MIRKNMILATAANGLPNNSGFYPIDAIDVAFENFHRAGLWIGPRDELENLPYFKQILPYIAISTDNKTKYLSYARTKAGAESRLHDLLSIGLGGHIDASDITMDGDCVNLSETFKKSIQRELSEEAGITKHMEIDWQGIIVDNTTEVGRCHVGVAGVVHLDHYSQESADVSIGNLRPVTLAKIALCKEEYEGWSQLFIDHLQK